MPTPALHIVGTPQAFQHSLSGAITTLAFPTGWVPGNLAIIWTGCHFGSGVLTIPSGWLLTPSSPTSKESCIYRVLQSGDTPPVLTWPGANQVFGAVVVLAGDLPTDPSQLFEAGRLRETSSTGTVPYGSLAVSNANDFALAMGVKWKSATANGATVSNLANFAPVVPALVPSGTDVIATLNWWQQTTPTALVLGGQTVSIGDTSDYCAGYGLLIKTQASASAAFTVPPNITGRTALPTGAYTIGFTPSGTGTFYAVAVTVDGPAPSAAQIEAGLDGHGNAALAVATKVVTGADSVTLGGSLTVALTDIYCVLHTTVDSAVVGLTAQFLLATAGQQLVVVTTLPTAGQDSILSDASPAAAMGDVIECDLLTIPDSYALSISGAGIADYVGLPSTESFTTRLFQRSTSTWSARVTNFINNFVPRFVGFPAPLAFPFQAVIPPTDLTPGWVDPNGGQVVVTALSGLPPGVFVTGSQLAGAGSQSGSFTATMRGTDPAGDFVDGPVTIVIGNITVPTGLIGQLQLAAVTAVTQAFLNPVPVLVPSSLTAGTVIAVTPAEGASVALGSTVILSIATPLPDNGGGDGGGTGGGDTGGGTGGGSGGTGGGVVIIPPPVIPPIQTPGAIVARLSSVQLALSDVSQFWGQDLVLSNTQDIDVVSGTLLGQQRILRRLLTNPGDYLFQPNYGAGLPQYIGQTTDVAKITALIKSQIALESVVATDPAPVITVTNAANSTDASALAITIAYTDAPTGSPQVLSFSLSK